MASVAARSGLWEQPETSGEVLINAGGFVYPVSRRGLLMPFMRQRYISVLLMHFADGLPRDADGHVYLETSPAYFEALLDELTLYETGRTNTVDLPPSKAADPAYSEYHSLFMREISAFSPSADQQTPLDAVPAHDAGVKEATQLCVDFIEKSTRAYVNAIKGLWRIGDDIKAFLADMDPFMKSSSDADNALLSLTVLGRRVTIMKKTLCRLGDDHPLLTRFSDTAPNWPDRRVRETPAKHFITAVEFARRMRPCRRDS
ncbi:unnamed protein product [Vitrella brassicaformis CCMP3155]|uniref:Potassium channel tetramerisation-type BTB domain-containing protein n=1 Tax=Vitrella brassicaformis (strain CCMP3155) TaxID=1169540 RepID=A0A0G4G3A8_VITBC|nr:unnamed protein product [Vitrella brassicaformis CCMP3155]|eukprot:CEM22586.1 unnamed protein product [Vitrella brassicaformis CCMP3155]